jgi:hypothetical protein
MHALYALLLTATTLISTVSATVTQVCGTALPAGCQAASCTTGLFSCLDFGGKKSDWSCHWCNHNLVPDLREAESQPAKYPKEQSPQGCRAYKKKHDTANGVFLVDDTAKAIVYYANKASWEADNADAKRLVAKAKTNPALVRRDNSLVEAGIMLGGGALIVGGTVLAVCGFLLSPILIPFNIVRAVVKKVGFKLGFDVKPVVPAPNGIFDFWSHPKVLREDFGVPDGLLVTEDDVDARDKQRQLKSQAK